MMKATILFLALLPVLVIEIYAQQAGNAVYGQGYNTNYGKDPINTTLSLSDSTFLIEANVALNAMADEYVATFGVEEEASTLKEANERIEKRINIIHPAVIEPAVEFVLSLQVKFERAH